MWAEEASAVLGVMVGHSYFGCALGCFRALGRIHGVAKNIVRGEVIGNRTVEIISSTQHVFGYMFVMRKSVF